jgi:DNA replication protein DnaC
LTCEICSGVGFEIVDEDGVQYARPCACRRGGKVGGDAFLDACRIPPRYESGNLATFEPYTPSHAAALEKALRYCKGYPFLGADEGLGLLLTGTNGVGKTHLAVAVLRELVTTKGARGQFWDFHELMREIKNSYDPETKTSELQVLSPVIDTDVLLLDDLGAWKITDWMNDTLFHILNSRYLAKRPTLITTNFQDVSADEARKADANVRREFFVDRIGNRLRSRLMEMCLLIRMDGGDFREHKQQSNRFAVTGTSGGADAAAPVPPRTTPRPRFGG